MILQKDNIILRPTKDIDYIADLAVKYKYNKLDRATGKELLKKYGYLFWKAYFKKEKVGVFYLTKISRGFSIDGYKEPKIKRMTQHSFIVTQLIMKYAFKYLTDTLFTLHDERNRLAIRLMKTLGFKEIEKIDCVLGKFILLRKTEKGRYYGVGSTNSNGSIGSSVSC